MFFFNQKIFKILISIIAAFFYMLASPMPGAAFETREIGVVVVDRLNMRLGPGMGYPVVKVLEKDDQVRVLSPEGNWLQVMHESDVGYIADRSRFVKLYKIHSVSDGRQTDLDIATAKAAEIKEKVREQTEEVEQYSRKEKEIVDALDKTERVLTRLRKELSVIESDLAAVAGNMSAIQEKMDQAQEIIDKSSGYAIKRLVSLYKLNKLGEMNLLASATSLHDLMQRRAAVEKILHYDHRVISELADKKSNLCSLADALRLEKQKKERLNHEHQAAAAALEKEKKQRQKLLAEIRQKKANRLATIKYLKQAAIKLDSTINSLRRGNATGQETDNNFSAYQGLLKMPVSGKVVSTFGKYVEPRSGVSNFRNGIEIQARHGAPIRAVFSGQTIYSSWLKGYGNVIIIAHGKHYHSVYAHAEELFRSKGETVEIGEVIATVGDSGSLGGPTLYFEIRHQGNPVDPLEWISKS